MCHFMSYLLKFFNCIQLKLNLRINIVFQETTFIEQIVEDENQMEGIPLGCNRIMNWHLHLEAHGLAYPKGWILPKNLDVVIPSK